MAKKATRKAIHKGIDLIKRYPQYGATIGDVDYIRQASTDEYIYITSCFSFGFYRGYQAAKAEMKKRGGMQIVK